MRKLPPLATLRAFEAAARHLSFKRAAEELAVTPTAISHQIRLLEDVLGKKLFERQARRVTMTPAGQILYPTLRDSFDAMAEAIESLHGSTAGSTVTLTATMAFTSKWLVPRAAAFRSRFPAINLRLLASDDIVDLKAGDADIAVRYGGGPYPGCRSEFLFQGRFAPVCSPRLGIGEPKDLDHHPLIYFEWRRVDENTPLWPRWFAKARRRYKRTGGDLVFSDETHAIQAAAAGHGIALLSLALVADEIAAGVLASPFGPVLQGLGFHVVIPHHHAEDDNVSAVRDWLVSEVQATT
jgi:LysR family glycine cleavage system transcriptional activator